MCPPRVHVSYCEWLLESTIQTGGTTAVFHNKLHSVQSQWLHDLSEQSVLGLHDLWTGLPVTFIHREHSRKMLHYNNLQTIAQFEANAQAVTVVIRDREFKSVAMNFLRWAQQCLDMWGEHLQIAYMWIWANFKCTTLCNQKYAVKSNAMLTFGKIWFCLNSSYTNFPCMAYRVTL